MVILSPTTFLSEGNGWKLQSDNTVVVRGLVGNVTVYHFVLDIPDESGLPFYQQHSVVLMAGAAVAVTVVAAVLVVVKTGRVK